MERWSIEGKRVIVTGSTDGIGKETAKELLKRGAKVVIHGRSKEKIEKTVEELKNYGEVEGIRADFSSLSEVKGMAKEVEKRFPDLKVLINNAGVFEPTKRLSKDSYEMTFAVNHLAHFALTLLILPLLSKNQPSRIINVSSMAHSYDIDFSNLQGEKGYSAYTAYSYSKLANILFTFELAERLKNLGLNITVNCLHPGVIGTKLLRKGWGIGGGSVEEGAKMSVYLAESDDVSNVTGEYFRDMRVSSPADIAYDRKIRERLWNLSEKITSLSFKEIVSKM